MCLMGNKVSMNNTVGASQVRCAHLTYGTRTGFVNDLWTEAIVVDSTLIFNKRRENVHLQ